MFNPGDNRSLNCFVKENYVDRDFKLATYPLWSEANFVLTNEICKVKELYYKVSTEPRIASLAGRSSLDMIKLHHDLAEVTDKWVSDIRECSEAYTTGIRQTFAQFANSLDPSKRIDAKITRCFEPYLNEAQVQRKAQFEAFQKNLVDGLFWEPSKRGNRTMSTRIQPSVCNSTTRDNTKPRVQQPELPKLDWDGYNNVHFASKVSAVVVPSDDQERESVATSNSQWPTTQPSQVCTSALLLTTDKVEVSGDNIFHIAKVDGKLRGVTKNRDVVYDEKTKETSWVTTGIQCSVR